MSSVPDASFTATASPTKTSSVASEPPPARTEPGRFESAVGASPGAASRSHAHPTLRPATVPGMPLLHDSRGTYWSSASASTPTPSSDANDARSKTPLAKVLRRWC